MAKAIWAYDSFLTPEECQLVIDFCEDEQREWESGTVGVAVGEYKVHDQTRNNQISWIHRTDDIHPMGWLFERLDAKMWVMNDYWFQVDYEFHGCLKIQYSLYRPGEYYHRHMDTGFRDNQETQRKLSCSVLLSDPADFTGGDLDIYGGKLDQKEIQQGQIYVFPSIVTHEVEVIQSGIRRSLVAWYRGPSWR